MFLLLSLKWISNVMGLDTVLYSYSNYSCMNNIFQYFDQWIRVVSYGMGLDQWILFYNIFQYFDQ